MRDYEARETPTFWMDGDGRYWVSAPGATPQEALDKGLAGGIDDWESDHALVVVGEVSTVLTDCPLDGCEGHPADDPDKPGETIYLDCPAFRRTVWEIEALEADGLAFDPIEKAIAEGRAVHVPDNLVVRDGQVHWSGDCWCERCDPFIPAAAALRPTQDHEGVR